MKPAIEQSAIAEGIKHVSVGKKGSKSLSPELAKAILDELKATDIPAIIKGAFFGTLLIKGVTEDEHILDQAFETQGTLANPAQLVEAIAGDAPDFVKRCCVQILENKTLDQATTRKLGDFLFSKEVGDGARGMIAGVLRVRYETPDEYAGLLESMNATITESFQPAPPNGNPIIQIAEPFDGVDHSNLVTPLLADFLHTLNYRTVSLCGRNSGPKYGNNLLDLAQSIDASIINGSADINTNKPDFGFYINQKTMSLSIDRWVDYRQQIIKRPFPATLERFVNPINADICLASAFHPPYGEKMLTICERAGFPAAIIVRNGLEGTIAFPLMRAARILCSVRQTDGTYTRHEIIFDAKEQLGITVTVEEKLTNPSLDKNRDLILEYKHNGQTDYELFNHRVKATCEGIRQAIEWINKEGGKDVD